MTQLNTPYPATAYLTGFLRSRGIEAAQADPAMELFSRLFCRDGLELVRAELRGAKDTSVCRFLESFDRYRMTVDAAVRFLRGGDPALAYRIVSREFLPEGPNFERIEKLNRLEGAEDSDDDPLTASFGTLGTHDRATYLASLYLDDIADVIRLGIDTRFEFERYAERLAESSASFDPIAEALSAPPTLVDRLLDEITDGLIEKYQPELLGLTAPFPGNVYGAFRIARRARASDPRLRIALGGGFVNTELRQLREPRVFDFFDFVTLDDGERPLLCILEHLEGKRGPEGLVRTFVREKGAVVLKNDAREHDIPHKDTGTPTYSGLELERYLAVIPSFSPVARLTNDRLWNKLTLAHGCYWRKCSFCDVNLDYIGRYDPSGADLCVDRIEELMRETGRSGFHFVDEAAPPALLRSMAEALIRRGVQISWWGNVRFDKAFTPS